MSEDKEDKEDKGAEEKSGWLTNLITVVLCGGLLISLFGGVVPFLMFAAVAILGIWLQEGSRR